MRIVRSLVLAAAVVAASASPAQATSFTYTSDTTWLVTNALPGAGWNTSLGFNTASWQTAVNVYTHIPACIPICIWYDNQLSTTREVWFRDTFFLDGPAITATLTAFADDDAQVWINGNLVYSVFDGAASGFGTINIQPFLVTGSNLIAVYAVDASAFWIPPHYEHNFGVNAIAVETAPAPVPEPTSLLLLGSGLALVARRYRRSSV